MTDHLALGLFALELARRARRASSGDAELEAALGLVAEQGIAQDIALYKHMMRRLGFSWRSPKLMLALAGERAGRAKLNGRLRRRSPLSSFEELDFLAMAIDNKVLLWENLRDLAGLGGRLPDVDFDHLITRARDQRAELEPFRARAGRTALGGDARQSTRAAPAAA